MLRKISRKVKENWREIAGWLVVADFFSRLPNGVKPILSLGGGRDEYILFYGSFAAAALALFWLRAYQK